MRIWQAATVFIMGIGVLDAAEKPKSFSWDPPKVAKSLFTRDVGMLDTEREDYATNLASLAANQVVASKASPDSLADSRRMIGLALQLSPRNKRALVASFQLSKGILPASSETAYSPPVFARLLLARGQLLEKQGGEENKLLARYLIQIAATLDPKNDDAVYASEVQRLDDGPLDWDAVTGDAKPSAKDAGK